MAAPQLRLTTADDVEAIGGCALAPAALAALIAPTITDWISSGSGGVRLD